VLSGRRKKLRSHLRSMSLQRAKLLLVPQTPHSVMVQGSIPHQQQCQKPQAQLQHLRL
jgi:hypothetical protein